MANENILKNDFYILFLVFWRCVYFEPYSIRTSAQY